MAGFLDTGKERKLFKKLDRDFGNFELETMKTPNNNFPKPALPRFKNSQLTSFDDQSSHFHSTNHWDKRSNRRYHGENEYRGGKSWRNYESCKENFKGDAGYHPGSDDASLENSMITPVILTREKNANDIKFISNSIVTTTTSVTSANPMSVIAAPNFNQMKECEILNNDQVPPPVSTPTLSKQYQIAPKSNPLEVMPELEMTSPLKLLDDSLLVGEDFGPYLLDQSNFLVIAVVGLQGTGKSTIASMLANPLTEEKFVSNRSWIFRPESRDEVLRGSHSTSGIETFITKERVIILDLQPLLSPSVMDFVVAQERKTSLDFSSSTENMLEIESLQLLTFAMSVAHVLIVVQDYIFHPNLIRLLHTCQMMKPTQSSSSHNSSSGVGNNRDGMNRCSNYDSSEIQHFFPHLVFIHNRSFPQHFVPKFIEELQILYHATLGDSSLCIESQIGMCSGTFSPPVNNISVNLNINLFLIPDFNYQNNCCVSFIESIEEMRRQLFSLSRCPLTHVTLTEKSWYQYACRMWESIRKSSLYVEYSRLLP